MTLSEVSNQILPALLPEQGNNQRPINVLVTKDTDTIASTAPVGASAVLTPAIQSAFKATDMVANDLDLIVVSVGPGSFTGLRVGIVTAKTLAYATNCPVVGVHVAEALALQSLSSIPSGCNSKRLAIGLDIGRGEILTYAYEVRPAGFTGDNTGVIMQPTDWASGFVDEQMAIGSGAMKYLNDEVKNRLILPPQQTPSPFSITAIGALEFAQNGGCDFWKLEPVYSRPSTAEEVRNKSNKP